jgi:hypothetical protein
MYCIQHCFIYRPSDSTLLEDAGIDPRTVATSALAAYLLSNKHELTRSTRLKGLQVGSMGSLIKWKRCSNH